MARLLVVQFLVPREDRAGKRYSFRVIRALRNELVERYGGWSLTSLEPLPGAWRNPETGATEEDLSWRYEVAVPEDGLDALDEFLAVLAVKLGQAAIYRVVLGQGAVIAAKKRVDI